MNVAQANVRSTTGRTSEWRNKTFLISSWEIATSSSIYRRSMLLDICWFQDLSHRDVFTCFVLQLIHALIMSAIFYVSKFVVKFNEFFVHVQAPRNVINSSTKKEIPYFFLTIFKTLFKILFPCSKLKSLLKRFSRPEIKIFWVFLWSGGVISLTLMTPPHKM